MLRLQSIFKCSVFIVLLIISGGAGMACEYDICQFVYFGQTISGYIYSDNEIHAYSFAANAGDHLLIRANSSYILFKPHLELLNSDKKALAITGYGDSYTQIYDLVLEHDDDYTLLVMDYGLDGWGAYSLIIQRTNNPSPARMIEFDTIIQDTISTTSELHIYQFDAVGGETVNIEMLDLAATIEPYLELFSPEGAPLTEFVDSYEAIIDNYTLIDPGRYTLIASDAFCNEAGEYQLTFERLALDADLIDPLLPQDLSLGQNYPNPFNPTTRIEFYLPRRGLVSLDIYNVLGEKVANILSEYLSAGEHTIEWDGCSATGQPAASGIYFYRLQTDNAIQTRKMVLMR